MTHSFRVNDMLARLYPEDKEKTKKARHAACRVVLKALGLPVDSCLKTALGQPGATKSVIEYLKREYKPGTAATHLNYILAGIKKAGYEHFPEVDRQALCDEKNRMNALDNAIKGESSRNPRVADKTWEDFIALEKRWRETEFGSRRHTLLAVHVLLAPRRNDDLMGLRLETDAEEWSAVADSAWVGKPPPQASVNTLTEDGSKLRFRQFKSIKTVGKTCFDLRASKMTVAKADLTQEAIDANVAKTFPEMPVLADILAAYIRRYKIVQGMKLFADPAATIKVISEEVGCEAGVMDMRHLWQSWVDAKQRTANELRVLSWCVGHTPAASINYVTALPERGEETAPPEQVNNEVNNDSYASMEEAEEADMRECPDFPQREDEVMVDLRAPMIDAEVQTPQGPNFEEMLRQEIALRNEILLAVRDAFDSLACGETQDSLKMLRDILRIFRA